MKSWLPKVLLWVAITFVVVCVALDPPRAARVIRAAADAVAQLLEAL